MRSLWIAFIVFGVTFGGALAGMGLRAVLPPEHQDSDSKDVIKLVTGLIATIAALVLSLLIASAHDSYNTQQTEVRQLSVHLAELDQILALYGPAGSDARSHMRKMAINEIERIWPVESKLSGDTLPRIQGEAAVLFNRIASLPQTSSAERFSQDRALQLLINMGETRRLLHEQAGGSLSWPFLVILVFWLVVLFTSFGFFGRFNGTVTSVLFVGAVSVAAALFLILEMNRPFSGIMQISDAPMRNVLMELGP